jgi:hypothetical protein
MTFLEVASKLKILSKGKVLLRLGFGMRGFGFNFRIVDPNPDLENKTLFPACLCEHLKGA